MLIEANSVATTATTGQMPGVTPAMNAGMTR